MWYDDIEKIIYINLDEATERREHIENQFLDIPKEKIIRFSAIKDSWGVIGCTKSHIECLKMAIENGWKNVLILEDDAMFHNKEIGEPLLKSVIKDSYDVILLGGSFVQYDPNTYRLTSAQTTTAYLVGSHYYSQLLANFEEGLSLLLITGDYTQFTIDQFWKRMMVVDRWFVIYPCFVIQKPGYSYIENRDVDYREYFI
jgi:glycosyl transferase, family 25